MSEYSGSYIQTPYGTQPTTPPPRFANWAAPGGQPAGAGYGTREVKDHPHALGVLLLGVLGVVGGVLPAWIAWYLGGKARNEIEAGAPYSWGGNLKLGYQLGKVLGIIYIFAMLAPILWWLLVIVFAVSLF